MAETINTQTTGYECVGIEKIEQTYEGLFDNKPNIITIYLTNGDTHQFKVMNGSQGVGIDRIEQRQTSTTNGGRNEFAIILTNGKEYTFSTYNGSGGSGSSGSFNQVLQHLNNLLMPSGKSYLYYNGSGFEWKSPDGSTGGGTADLSEYSWWGRKFAPASKSITGEMSAVTSIEFQSTKGETTIRKKLYLDENGDLCFNGNLYATGGITALGSGGGTSGGGNTGGGTISVAGNGTMVNSAVSLLNIQYPSGLSDVVVSEGDGVVDIDLRKVAGSGGTGVTLSPIMDAMNRQLTNTTMNTPQFLYWNGITYTWKNESEISGGSGGSGSIQVAQTPEYAGGSESWVSTTKLRFVGITGTKPTIRPNSEKSCVDVGIPVGGGSGSSGTTAGKLYFSKDTESDREAYWNGESNFRIIFGSGLNVSWDSTTQITLSATGGSSTGGGSVDLSSYLTKTEASTTYAAKYHTHSAASITGFEDAVKLIKVNNAVKADKANELNSAVTLWGNYFYGSNNIGTSTTYADLQYVKNIYTGNTFDIYNVNNEGGHSVLGVDRTSNVSIAYGYRSNENATISLFGNKTKIYTNGQDYHFDFKSNVFDVNSNQIHFGSETNGGKISWDRTNNAFKIEGNVYATGGITALGVSNNATTSNNVDFTFKSVTANTFDVKDSIQLSSGLKLSNNDDGDVYFTNIDTASDYHSIFLDDGNNYKLDSNGDAYFNTLSCTRLDIPGGADNFQVVDINDRDFTIRFKYNGKTYSFTPSEANVNVS